MRARTSEGNPSANRNRGNRSQARNRPSGGAHRGKPKGNQPRSRKGGPKNKKAANQRKRNRRPNKPNVGANFWGDPANLPAPSTDVRMTDAPSAVPRSLGPAPLPGHEVIAEHYFTAVYDRAVATAGALAAAGGLIDPHALVDDQ